eukprot:1149586-Pelagomonas_calceolata.AAC.5
MIQQQTRFIVTSSSNSNPGSQTPHVQVKQQPGGRSSCRQSTPIPHLSAPTAFSPSSRSNSTRAEHGRIPRSWEERTSSKPRLKQLSSSAQNSAGNLSNTEPSHFESMKYGTSGGYVGPPSYGVGPPVVLA